MSNEIRFDNGAAYEQYMGLWSQLVGEAFLEWLDAAQSRRWLDVGCGNGAFTEQIAMRAAPASITGIDPSEGMLSFARSRLALREAQFQQGSAMALPFGDSSFDIAVMPLVIFFVPVPAQGVAEMARVVCPGGIVAAYSWDMIGGGFPYAALREELQALGVMAPEAPNNDASRLESKRELWTRAGLVDLETTSISVQRSFADFDEYWKIIQGGPSVSATLATLTPGNAALLKERMRMRLPADAGGRISYAARANAIKGRVPA